MIPAVLFRFSQGNARQNPVQGVPAASPLMFLPLIQAHAERILAILRKATPTQAGNPDIRTPGRLRAGWYSRIEVNKPAPGKVTLLIGNRDDRFQNLMKWLTGGTRPHTIRAIRSRILRFYWIRKGYYAFFIQVKHPGTKPNAALIRAHKEAIDEGKKLQSLVRARVLSYMRQGGSV